MEQTTFTLEAIAARSANYYEKLVDARGLPYFNVFWAEPSLAAHDWPDYGDVMSRQLQGAIMLRRMTGRTVGTEKTWKDLLFSYLDPSDGLLYRPATTWSRHEADWGDAALTLYALVTAYADSGDEKIGRAASRMAESLLARARDGKLPSGDFGGFAIKSLVTCARQLKCEPAMEAARIIVGRVFGEQRAFTRDNTFRHGGHMHGNLRTLVGTADFALHERDPELWGRVDALYRWVRSIGTRFGFLPESYGRKGDVVLCETCALMDYAGLGTTLANHGHPEYWADMERLARNQYAESQVRDGSWLHSDNGKPDTEQFTWHHIDQRVLGAWAGWTSPTHILAVRETLGAHWGGPELHGKTRALQNCCGGSGVHGLFILWKNAARFENGRLWVHMHLDKALPQAEIRCLQPWKGQLSVAIRQPCDLRVRIPDFVHAADLRVTSRGAVLEPRVSGNYVEIDGRTPGERIEITYPQPVVTTEESIGNPGFRAYRYQVTWKGDTVVQMTPLGENHATGYSDFDKKEVPIFYGAEGPGPLYQREHMRAEGTPGPGPLHEDDGGLDFWYGLGKESGR